MKKKLFGSVNKHKNERAQMEIYLDQPWPYLFEERWRLANLQDRLSGGPWASRQTSWKDLVVEFLMFAPACAIQVSRIFMIKFFFCFKNTRYFYIRSSFRVTDFGLLTTLQ